MHVVENAIQQWRSLGITELLVLLNVEICHLSGAQNLEVGLTLLKDIWSVARGMLDDRGDIFEKFS
jgi:hypothetical protein